MSTTTTINISERVDALDWDQLREQLDTQGHAVTEPLLRKGETRDLAGLFDDEERFRSTIDMARYRFGDGRYRYFDHPLPDAIAELCARRSTAASRRSPTTGPSCCAATTRRSRSSTTS
jgi:hypothetical protein